MNTFCQKVEHKSLQLRACCCLSEKGDSVEQPKFKRINLTREINVDTRTFGLESEKLHLVHNVEPQVLTF